MTNSRPLISNTLYLNDNACPYKGHNDDLHLISLIVVTISQFTNNQHCVLRGIKIKCYKAKAVSDKKESKTRTHYLIMETRAFSFYELIIQKSTINKAFCTYNKYHPNPKHNMGYRNGDKRTLLLK